MFRAERWRLFEAGREGSEKALEKPKAAQGGPRWPLGHLGFSQGFSHVFDPWWPRRPTRPSDL